MPTDTPENYPEPVYVATPNKGKAVEEKKQRSQVNSQSAPRNEDVQPSNTVIRPHDISHEQFLKQLIEQRNAPDPTPPAPPPVPPRIMDQTRAEMEAGRARVARFEAQEAARPKQAPPSEKEGLMTPVHRPGDHVPKIV